MAREDGRPVSYQDFLATKKIVAPTLGMDVERDAISDVLFEFQRDLVHWALRKGRAAIFADTGLGKTLMQLEWARLTGERTLILAPLAVAQQTIREAEKLGLDTAYAPNQKAAGSKIVVSNYERLDRFDPDAFGAVVLDESSILKSFSGVTKKALVEAFRSIELRLCCTATPAPNDTVEVCNHADFLSLMSPADMLSSFFISKGSDQKSGRFRLKRHARDAFYRWLASWSMSLKKPSDLGYPDDGFELPPLEILPTFIDTDWTPDDQLFATGLQGVTHRAEVRRATLDGRIDAAAELVDAESDQQWLVWTGLNDEANGICKHIDEAVNVQGSDSPERKAEVLSAFAAGEVRVMVTKPSIAGFGMNFQSCSRMAFVGLGDSYEQYYQAIRRCWRFGQTRPVHAHVVLSKIERAIFDNVLDKEAKARELSRELVRNVSEFERAEIASAATTKDYDFGDEMEVPAWLQTV